MTENNLFKKLQNLKVPQVETPIHKESLKKALLTAHQNMQSKPFIIPNLFINMKNFAPVSLLAIALVGGVLYGTNLLSSPMAYAKSMIEQAIVKVEHSNMAPEQQQKVLDVLKEAKEAKDLKFLGEKETAEDGKVKSLSFTDTHGKAVVVDLDEDDSEKPVKLEGQEENSLETSDSLKTETDSAASENKDTSGKEVEDNQSTDTKVEVKEAVETEDKVEVKAPESNTSGKETVEAVKSGKDAAEAVEVK